jgi:hypothetical protein
MVAPFYPAQILLERWTGGLGDCSAISAIAASSDSVAVIAACLDVVLKE